MRVLDCCTEGWRAGFADLLLATIIILDWPTTAVWWPLIAENHTQLAQLARRFYAPLRLSEWINESRVATLDVPAIALVLPFRFFSYING